MRTIAIFLLVLSGIMTIPAQTEESSLQAKFLPPQDKTLFIIGQDLGAIGGMPGYSEGYVDHVTPRPAGVTTYTNLHALDGLTTLANWGSGDVNAQMLADAYPDSTLAVGLWLANTHLKPVIQGNFDGNIERLGTWINAQKRPVFLRIGYEFDGEWNAYPPEDYRAAFRHIVDQLRAHDVTNFATVWQSATWHLGTWQARDWLEWYPGDDYVDWFGMSYFIPHPATFNAWLELAREHRKPVMIAEATPKGHDLSREDGEQVWAAWFTDFFAFIHDNADVIKAVAYINVRWDDQPMWHDGTWGDSRVQANPLILERWQQEMSSDLWLHAVPDLFTLLQG